MAAEIAEQPAAFRRILDGGLPAIADVAAAIRRRRPRFVVFVGRGTSDHAALYAKYLVETMLGLPAGLASPSAVTVYDGRPDMRDVLLIVVSQSGGSPDLLAPLEQARRRGAITLAVTNASNSPVAGAAEYRLDVLAGPERAVAATKTYTAELLTLYLLVAELAGVDHADVTRLPERAEAILAREPEVGEMAVRYRFAEQVITTARGYNYATALEAALKLMETSYLVAHGFSAADLLHGPMAMIDRGFPVIAVAAAGPGGEAMRPVLDRLADLGADTLVLGDPALCRRATVAFPLPDLGREVLSPLLTILPLQLLAFSLARQRGNDPDQPRSIEKVTRTW